MTRADFTVTAKRYGPSVSILCALCVLWGYTVSPAMSTIEQAHQATRDIASLQTAQRQQLDRISATESRMIRIETMLEMLTRSAGLPVPPKPGE